MLLQRYTDANMQIISNAKDDVLVVHTCPFVLSTLTSRVPIKTNVYALYGRRQRIGRLLNL